MHEEVYFEQGFILVNDGNHNTSQSGDGVEAIALKKKKDIDKISSVIPRPGLL